MTVWNIETYFHIKIRFVTNVDAPLTEEVLALATTFFCLKFKSCLHSHLFLTAINGSFLVNSIYGFGCTSILHFTTDIRTKNYTVNDKKWSKYKGGLINNIWKNYCMQRSVQLEHDTVIISKAFCRW